MGLPRNKKYTERQYVENMIRYCEKAIEFTKGMDQETFFADKYAKVATEGMLLKIGWSAYNLPRDMFDLYPEIDRRYLIAVGYMMIKSESTWTIDGKLVWSMVQDTIPAVLPILKTLQRSWQKSVEDIPEDDRVPEKHPLIVEAQEQRLEVIENVEMAC